MFATLLATFAFAETPCKDQPEDLYFYQDQILALSKKVSTATELKQQMARPLGCLLEAYKTNDDFLTQYVAGSCLQRLMGGPEIAGFKKMRKHEIIYESLFNQQLSSGDILTKSEVAALASGKWMEYIKFCRGTVTEELCKELLPTNEHIKQQNELLGATSMLVLKSAYLHFSGDAKNQVLAQIKRLYQETSRSSVIKRRVIEEIYKDLQNPLIELRGS